MGTVGHVIGRAFRPRARRCAESGRGCGVRTGTIGVEGLAKERGEEKERERERCGGRKRSAGEMRCVVRARWSARRKCVLRARRFWASWIGRREVR